MEELRQGTQLSGMLEGYQECFRRIVYENKAAAGDSELIKLSKYYLGHVHSELMLEAVPGDAGLAGPR